MSESLSIVETASRRPSRQLSSVSILASPRTDRRGSISTDRRPSLFSFGRHKKSVRPKPRLDEATLRAKQEWAAKGLLTIMRKKVAERRRIAFGETAPGTGDEFRNRDEAPSAEAALDTDVNRDQSAQQTMINGYIISAIPYMPKSVAAMCFILNLIIPGSGINCFLFSL